MKIKYIGNNHSSIFHFFITIKPDKFAINQAKNGKTVSVSGYLYILINIGIAARKSANIQNIIPNNGLFVDSHNINAKIAKNKQK